MSRFRSVSRKGIAVNITNVEIDIPIHRSGRLLAFAKVLIDDEFVIHNLRVIDGNSNIYVAMPTRKLEAPCRTCGRHNHLLAAFCCECGCAQEGERFASHRDGSPMIRANGQRRIYEDVAHPINEAGREKVEGAVLRAYREAVEAGNGQVVPQQTKGDLN